MESLRTSTVEKSYQAKHVSRLILLFRQVLKNSILKVILFLFSWLKMNWWQFPKIGHCLRIPHLFFKIHWKNSCCLAKRKKNSRRLETVGINYFKSHLSCYISVLYQNFNDSLKNEVIDSINYLHNLTKDSNVKEELKMLETEVIQLFGNVKAADRELNDGLSSLSQTIRSKDSFEKEINGSFNSKKILQITYFVCIDYRQSILDAVDFNDISSSTQAHVDLLNQITLEAMEYTGNSLFALSNNKWLISIL